MPGNAPVVRAPEVDLVSRPLADALSQRRAAVLREGGRVEHAVRDFLVLLPCRDAKTDHVGVDLDADIGLARLHAVPFPVANEAPARQNAAVSLKIVLYHRPPADRERHGRPPVHRAKAHPFLRHLKRLCDVALGAPTVEERTQGNRPVAIEPCGNEFLTAGSPQVLLISVHIDVAVVIDLGRNEDSLKAGLLIADDPVAQRARIDVTGLDPLMARPARVSRRSEAYRNPRARAQGGHQLENRSRRRESADFLAVEPRLPMPL